MTDITSPVLATPPLRVRYAQYLENNPDIASLLVRAYDCSQTGHVFGSRFYSICNCNTALIAVSAQLLGRIGYVFLTSCFIVFNPGGGLSTAQKICSNARKDCKETGGLLLTLFCKSWEALVSPTQAFETLKGIIPTSEEKARLAQEKLDLFAETERLSGLIAPLKINLDTLTQDIPTLTEKVAQLRKEHGTLTTQIPELENQVTSTETLLTSKTTLLNNINAEISKLSTQRDELNAALATKRTELQTTTTAMADRENRVLNQTQVLTNLILEETQRKAEIERKIKTLSDELEKLRLRNQTELANHLTTSNELQNSKQRIDLEVRNLSTTKNELTSQLDAVRAEKQQESVKVDEFKSSKQKLETQIADLYTQLTALGTKLEQSRGHYSRLKTSISIADERDQSLKQRLKDHESLEKSMKTAAENLKSFGQQPNNPSSELQASLQSVQKQLTKVIFPPPSNSGKVINRGSAPKNIGKSSTRTNNSTLQSSSSSLTATTSVTSDKV